MTFFCISSDKMLQFLQCSGHNIDEVHQEGHHLAGGNVHLIKTMDSWEEKLSEAIKDGKIVSFSAFLIS